MNFLPSLTSGIFAAVGLLCAAGPIVIHLLNRRRYRTVHWAAMDFLRESIQRSRRILELRDMLLLALRTLAVLFFGLALARPMITPHSTLMWTVAFPCLIAAALCAVVGAAKWSQTRVRWSAFGLTLIFVAVAVSITSALTIFKSGESGAVDASQPVHAVLLIDNSLSMGYESAWEGSLLEQAQRRAEHFIKRLPEESRVSIVPLCGSRRVLSTDPYTKADALQALGRIELVDRSMSIEQAILQAQQAGRRLPNLAQRVVLLSDQQASNWEGFTPSQQSVLPPMQIVDLSDKNWENAWISDLRIEDSLADIQTATTIIVELQTSGGKPHRDVEIKLTVDGNDVATKNVRLARDAGPRQVRFETSLASDREGRTRSKFVDIQAWITPDNLPDDDTRHLVAHVVDSLPVVFVDQVGADSGNMRRAAMGETRALRTLLAPRSGNAPKANPLVRALSLTIDQLDREVLKNARLVVIAGIADPQDKVSLLREYVQQGGPLIVAAGGAFDPQRWNELAWLDGAGILPAPLKGEMIGQLPENDPRQLRPFFLSYESLASHYYFQLSDTSQDELRELYSSPFFFQATQVDLSDEALGRLVEPQIERADEQSNRADWLLWSSQAPPEISNAIDLPDDLPLSDSRRQDALARLVQQSLPQVLARFDDEENTPYMVQRRIGRGSVLFVASGVGSSWNTLHTTNAMLVFDRILRSMIQATLPQRNFPARELITLPLESNDRRITLTLQRPGDREEPEILETGFIDEQRRGFSIESPLERGLYRVTATRTNNELAENDLIEELWSLPLAVNGQASESDLAPIAREQFELLTAGSPLSWVTADEEISLAEPGASGRGVWQWLILAVLVLLMIEMAILAWPAVKTMAVKT